MIKITGNSWNKNCTLPNLFYIFCYLTKKVDEVHVLLSLKNLLKKKLRGIRQKLEVHERNSGEVKDILIDMTTLASSNIKPLKFNNNKNHRVKKAKMSCSKHCTTCPRRKM